MQAKIRNVLLIILLGMLTAACSSGEGDWETAGYENNGYYTGEAGCHPDNESCPPATASPLAGLRANMDWVGVDPAVL